LGSVIQGVNRVISIPAFKSVGMLGSFGWIIESKTTENFEEIKSCPVVQPDISCKMALIGNNNRAPM
jgi:hypothetical protein